MVSESRPRPGSPFLTSSAQENRLLAGEGTVRFTQSVLSIDLWTAACWHIDLSGLRINLHRQDQAAAWTAAWHTLQQHQRGDTISSIIEAVARAEGAFGTIPALLEATGALQAKAACAAVGPLIGLGPGLTPAGDDFLVGYLAGLWSTANIDTARLRVPGIGWSLAVQGCF